MIRRMLPHVLDIVIAVTLSSVLARAAFVSPGAPSSVPSGTSVIIVSGSCPSGFVEETTARGRFLVGTPASGTLGGTVLSALTDLQDVTHQHTLGGGEDGMGHFHNDNTYGTGGTFGTGSIVQTNNTTASVTITRPLVSATSSGHPYLQVMVCRKS